MKKTVVAVIAVIASTCLLLSMLLTTGSAVGVSVLTAVIEATDTKEAPPEEVDTTEEEEPLPGTTIAGQHKSGEYFDDIHEMICTTDINALIADFEAGKTYKELTSYLNMVCAYSENKWTIAQHLYAYALAAEICMRPEINPDTSDVVIKPLHLLGEMLGESASDPSVFTYESSYDSYLWWMSKDYILSQSPATADLLEAQEGHTVDLGEQGTGNCVSPFGQMLWYSYNWDSEPYDTQAAGACIYISWMENPDIDDDKRAIIGSRKAIYNDTGYYITEDFWTQDSPLAPTAEISENIKIGLFTKGSEFGYNTRPSSYFLPDSMYTHALYIRSYISNYSTNERIKGILNYTDSSLEDEVKLATTDGKVSQDILSDTCIAIAMQRFSYPNVSYIRIPIEDEILEQSNLGIFSRVLLDLAYNGIHMDTGQSLGYSLERQHALTYYPQAIALKVLVGASGNSSFDKQFYELAVMLEPEKGSMLDQVKKGEDAFNSSLAAPRNDYEIPHYTPSNGAVSIDADCLTQRFYSECLGTIYSGEVIDATALFYGFNNVVAGHYWEHLTEKIAVIARQYRPGGTISHGDVPEDFIDGHIHLGDNCACNYIDTNAYNSKPASEADYAAIDYKEYALGSGEIMNAAKDLSSDKYSKLNVQTVKFSNYSTKQVIWDGAGMPLRMTQANTYPVMHTYINDDGRPHGALDMNSADNITGGSYVYPVADGIIIAIIKYPAYSDSSNWTRYSNATFNSGKGQRGYGNSVWVLHKGNDGCYYISYYAHLYDFAHITVGASVSTDTLLGYVGTTGLSTGPHLHLGFRKFTPSSTSTFSSRDSILYSAQIAYSLLSTEFRNIDNHPELNTTYDLILNSAIPENTELYYVNWNYMMSKPGGSTLKQPLAEFNKFATAFPGFNWN